MRRLIVYILPLAVYAALIFFLSSRSAFPHMPGWIWRYDKALHFSEYFVLGALICRALVGYGLGPRQAMAAAVLASSLYGASDEYHQLFTSNRSSDWRDWVADTLGAAAGALVWYALKRKAKA